MTNDQKIDSIKYICQEIMTKWKTSSRDNDIYEDGKTVGRSVLAQTILEIIDNG
jgi:hypothetical protein